jgi:hypothetical protein
MISLLAPFALAASVLLAIPVIIHLLKPKRVRVMPFSSLRWLRDSQHKLSRRIQWHQILLFLLRAAFLLALIFALARPVFSTKRDRRSTERFVILDVSRSMGYDEGDGQSPFSRGKAIAAAALAQSLPGDRSTVLLAGRKPVALGPLDEDTARHAARLDGAGVTLEDGDLSATLSTVRSMLSQEPRPDSRAELVFITDNPQNAWSQGAIASFANGLSLPVAVKTIDVGPAAPRNAWIAGARVEDGGASRSLVVRLGASGGDSQERTVRVTQPADLAVLSATATVPAGGFAEVSLPLPSGYDLTGQIAEFALEPGDALPHDDRFWLDFASAAGTRVLVVEPETTKIETLQPGHHLRTALGVLNDVFTTRRTPEAVTDADFQAADLIIFVNVPRLSDAQSLALESRVGEGGGLLVFLGPGIQTAYYNEKLAQLMPRPLAQPVQASNGSLAAFDRIDWTHPVLAPLQDPAYGDFTRVRASRYFQWSGDGGEVLAWFDAATPALIEHRHGAGRVLFVNTTANDEWSDLPRRNCFVPLIDHALNRLAHSRFSTAFQPGESISLAIKDAADTATVISPSGKSLTPLLRKIDGRAILRLDAADEIGVYTVRSGDGETRFIVQAGRGDSPVTKADPETLRTWWSGAESFEIVLPDPNEEPQRVIDAGRLRLWPWLLALAAVLLLAEMYFVHRLCPAMNPAVAASSIARHGIVAPAAHREEVAP